jgi:hypothetical protein
MIYFKLPDADGSEICVKDAELDRNQYKAVRSRNRQFVPLFPRLRDCYTAANR